MQEAIEKLGLHLAILLYKQGADDQAYAEIIDSLERARERNPDAPKDSSKELHETKRTMDTMDTADMRLLLGGAN